MLEIILNAVPNILLGISLVGLGVFGVSYVRNANWRKTAPGRALLYMILAMALILALSFVHLIVAPYPGIEFVRIVAYTLLTVTIWSMVSALFSTLRIDPLYLFRVRRRNRDHKHKR